MEKLKFIVLSAVVLGVIGLLGYWAVMTIEPGNAHFYKEKQEELEAKNLALQQEVADLKNELLNLQDEQGSSAPAPVDPTPTTPNPPQPSASSKHQTLINELQKLITDKVFMKVGSRGTRVGTVQNFLNVYNKTSKPIDNDYGPGMKTDVANFQKAVGLTADGEAGPATYQKMIDWLKKQ
jgi:murein L,D-transpeptidase YcbB/YkuD